MSTTMGTMSVMLRAVETMNKVRVDLERLQTLSNILIAQRDELLAAAQFAEAELDNVYDVDQDGERSKESPFAGAGEVLNRLRVAIARAQRGAS